MSSQPLIEKPLYHTFHEDQIEERKSGKCWSILTDTVIILATVLAFIAGIFAVMVIHRIFWENWWNWNSCPVEEATITWKLTFVDSDKQNIPTSSLNQKSAKLSQGDSFSEKQEKPNILLFLADDLGYGDLASYGNPTQPWGPLDELASAGVRFTQFYADSLCTPSRAQLLTGRIPVRTGMTGNQRVLSVGSSGGLPDEEITIAEMLHSNGYRTGMNGKWHLGINCERNDDGCHLPFHHGFGYVGTYYPTSNNFNCDEFGEYVVGEPSARKCMLYHGNGTSPIEAPVHKENLTHTFLAEAKEFISVNKENPWFFYFATPQVHEAVFHTKAFTGTTKRGEFGDTLNEMSWTAGELVKHLFETGQGGNTLFIFFSDNGATKYDCRQSGINFPLRGHKAESWEGGQRVPALAWWPGRIKPHTVSHNVFTSADLLPTIATLTGSKFPNDRIYDGVDISEIFYGNNIEDDLSIQRPIFFYCNRKLMAVRHGKYKAHYRTWKDSDLSKKTCSLTQGRYDKGQIQAYATNCQNVIEQNPPLLFQLENDPAEEWPLDPDEYKAQLLLIDLVVKEHDSKMDWSVKEQVDLQGCSETCLS